MKRFLIMLLMVMLTACGITRYADQRSVRGEDEISYVLYNNYPQLYEYYIEGVLRVTSLREVMGPDGNPDYRIRYSYVNYYYRNYDEKMAAVREHFPELYERYLNGVIEIGSVYKYVDRRTGEIRHHATLRYVNDYYYYNYYPDMRIFYHRRPATPPPPRMRPEPRPRPGDRPGMRPPEPRPGERPGARPGNEPRPENQPNVRPGNEPRPQQQPNVRPGNEPRPQQQPNARLNNPPTRSPGNGGQTTRPSNPPRTSAGGGSSSRAAQARRR